MRHHAIPALALGAVLLGSSTGHAQSAADRAAAQSLFESAMKLFEKKDYPAACRQLEESQKLDPGQGTQFRLASCFEAWGKTASAWAAYLEVADAAAASKQRDREKLARERASALAPRIPYLTLRAKEPGARITRDGEVVPPGQLGLRLAVDPGKHTLEATAEGREAWTQTIELSPGKETVVEIPLLVAKPQTTATAAPPEPPPPVSPVAPPEASPQGMGTQRKIAVGAFAVGGAALVGTVVFGALAKGKNDASADHCRAGDLCSPKGLELRDAALSRATVASVLGAASAVSLAAGGVLWLTVKPAAPSVGLQGSTLVVRGGF